MSRSGHQRRAATARRSRVAGSAFAATAPAHRPGGAWARTSMCRFARLPATTRRAIRSGRAGRTTRSSAACRPLPPGPSGIVADIPPSGPSAPPARGARRRSAGRNQYAARRRAAVRSRRGPGELLDQLAVAGCRHVRAGPTAGLARNSPAAADQHRALSFPHHRPARRSGRGRWPAAGQPHCGGAAELSLHAAGRRAGRGGRRSIAVRGGQVASGGGPRAGDRQSRRCRRHRFGDRHIASRTAGRDLGRVRRHQERAVAASARHRDGERDRGAWPPDGRGARRAYPGGADIRRSRGGRTGQHDAPA